MVDTCEYSLRLFLKLKLLDKKQILDLNLIQKAVYCAKKYHYGQVRKSQEPYYTHVLEVASITSEIYLETDIIVASILHDAVEDTDMTLAHIEVLFNENIATIVNGVTKIGSIGKRKIKLPESNKLYKLYETNDKVLIIKLADRLHNMRTLQYMSPKKQIDIAVDTIKTYIPICKIFGLKDIEAELFDIAKKYVNLENR